MPLEQKMCQKLVWMLKSTNAFFSKVWNFIVICYYAAKFNAVLRKFRSITILLKIWTCFFWLRICGHVTRTVSIHCRSTEVRQRNLSFFDRLRTTLNITSSNNIVGRRWKKLAFYLKREWERVVFDGVYNVCGDGKKTVPTTYVQKIKSLRLKKSFKIVRDILFLYELV